MRRIDFDELPAVDTIDGVHCRELALGGRLLKVVEFADGFCDTEWCERAHIGYCLSGEVEIEFADAVETYAPGNALVIEAGDRHRARVLDGPVRMFLVETP